MGRHETVVGFSIYVLSTFISCNRRRIFRSNLSDAKGKRKKKSELFFTGLSQIPILFRKMEGEDGKMDGNISNSMKIRSRKTFKNKVTRVYIGEVMN